jgi:hypothetical protein
MRVALASADRRAENVGICTVVVSELKLRNVQRQIFAAYPVIASHNATLNQRPETLNCVGVNRANDVLASLMIHNAVRVFVAKMVINSVKRQCKAS